MAFQQFDYTKHTTNSNVESEVMTTPVNKAKKKLQVLLETEKDEQKIQVIKKQLQKIESLKPIEIPTKDGIKAYYSIADSAGGVTEKTCLIDSETLKIQLEAIDAMKDTTNLEENAIKMNAILKHPKAGKDTEVQREEMGLEIARILGFEAITKSTMVEHNTGDGFHPCLFVPFEKMDLLTDKIEFAETSHARLKKEEFEKNEAGESEIEDFGKYAGFFALCSDPDFIGKAGQNKGVRGEGMEKKLYIFDQVFMPEQNLGLDRSFNLVPTNILSQSPNFIARHFMGRNKSVVNDSSFEQKIDGTLKILEKKADIKAMFIKAYMTHTATDELTRTLKEDAEQCLKSFNHRVDGLEKLFPHVIWNGKTTPVSNLIQLDASTTKTNPLELLKKSMLVTQLINKPKVTDELGKPYRAPFFNTGTYVESVSMSDTSDTVTISFARNWGKPLSDAKQETLKANGFEISDDGKFATITKSRLLALDATQPTKTFYEPTKNITQVPTVFSPPQQSYLSPFANQNSNKSSPKVASQNDSKFHALEVKSEDFRLPDEFKGFSGDFLKRKILEKFKRLIEGANTPADIETIKKEMTDSHGVLHAEYTVLTTGQGVATRIFGLATSSSRDLDQMIADRKTDIASRANQSQPPTPANKLK